MARWRHVTDGGLETDLIFHRGVDLPEFAAYPLVWTDEGRATLRDYYTAYADVAARAGAGLRLESPTWRANSDWAPLLGHGQAEQDDANRRAVELMHGLADEWRDRVADLLVVGSVGPRGDGYRPGQAVDPDEAAGYHAPQLAAFAAAGANRACALTLSDPGEAIGVVRAAQAAGLALDLGFTVETDGRLATGPTLREGIEAVDAVAAPASYVVNCAHPEHVLPALEGGGDWLRRIHGLRCNASTLTHAELDESETLDEGDLEVLVPAHRRIEALLPELEFVGGCCGTDVRHVAALWA